MRSFPDLPEIIFQASEGKFTLVDRFLTQQLGQMMSAASAVSMGLHLSVMCADYFPFTSRAAIDARGGTRVVQVIACRSVSDNRVAGGRAGGRARRSPVHHRPSRTA